MLASLVHNQAPERLHLSESLDPRILKDCSVWAQKSFLVPCLALPPCAPITGVMLESLSHSSEVTLG